jgi:hypothetical protein
MTFKSIFLGTLATIMFSNMYAQDSAVLTSENLETENEEMAVAVDTSVVDSLAISGDATKIRKPGKGWYFEVFGGWGTSFLPTQMKSPLIEIGYNDLYQRGQKELSLKPLLGTNGGGWAGNVTIGHMFNKNIGLDATITVAKHPEHLDSRIDIPGYFADQYTEATALYFAPHMVFKWDNEKKFGITGKVGLLLPFYGAVTSRAQILDKTGRMLQTLLGFPIEPVGGGLVDLEFRTTAATTLKPTVGVSASLAFDYKITKSIDLFASARLTAFTISLKETNFEEVYLNTKLLGIEIQELGLIKTQVRSADEAQLFLKKIIYRDELTLESNTGRYGGKVDLDKPMDEIAQKFNISTLYFNIGMSYSIDRWEKRSAKKAEKEKSAKKK